MTKRHMKVLGAIGVGFVFIAVVIGAFVPDDVKAPKAPKATRLASADGTNQEVSDALKDALTITSVTLSCPETVLGHGGSTMASGSRTVVIFNDRIGALKGTPPRLWSDALTVPYTETEPVNMLGATQAEICFNPHYGVTVAHFFAAMSVGDVKLVELNPWLKPFAVDAGQINDKAAVYTPLLDVNPKNITDEQAQEAVTQNIAWQQIAQRLGTLLARFQVDGIRAEQSVLNYHLTGGGASVGGLPEVGLNPNQENLPALMLKLTEKGACVPIKVIGFNTGDKRPEEFVPPTCNPPVKAVPPTTPKSPPPTKPKPPTTAPPRTTPTTTPATVPKTTSTTTPTPTTTVPPRTGKETPPNTVAPLPTTAAPPTTAPPNNGGQGDSGNGATNTTSPPTTQAPAPAPPVTSSPTTNPPPPPG